MNKQLEKYLRTRAVNKPWALEGSKESGFKAAIIIPALAEAESLPATLASLLSNPADSLQQTLVVVVVNNRPNSPAEQFNDNQKTLEWLNQNPYPQFNLCWVDVSSPGQELSEREGVGLARKIGFDLALHRLDHSRSPLLISLDADTLVEPTYLPVLFNYFSATNRGAVALPFRHQPGAGLEQEAAIRVYELYLRSYLFGLQKAGSPYAYHTIGSAFACTATTYIATGGMNRRLAAEDFYFLQQVAKVSQVTILPGTCVMPAARFSDRVPFGTGKVVQDQVERTEQTFQFISAAAFTVLRDWLQLVEAGLEQPSELLVASAENISEVLAMFLLELGFEKDWHRLQANHKTLSGRRQAFHGWFDALRTRQLLTRLDSDVKNDPEKLVADLLGWGGYPGLTKKPEQLQLLERLQFVV